MADGELGTSPSYGQRVVEHTGIYPLESVGKLNNIENCSITSCRAAEAVIISAAQRRDDKVMGR